ncbi:MAG: tRNA pseudouridine(38-40) synthase TruA [Pseudomonadota bacterium]
MPRFKLTIEYDGRPYAGWQRQATMPTVQGALEQACEAINGAPVVVSGAGRTDSGVHARGQVAHIDFTKPIAVRKVADALNAHLRPAPIAILKAEAVEETFDARFSATGRHYRYRIINRRASLTLDRGLAWRVPMALDADAMHAAAQALIGHHDFSTFRDSECQATSPVKTLDTIAVARTSSEIAVTCAARSFLHRQVRSIVGSLVEVGRGREPVSWIAEILAATDRTRCGPVAPADGLYLMGVDYGIANPE